MFALRQYPLLFYPSCAALIFLFLVTIFPRNATFETRSTRVLASHIKNTTLGFEKIFVISMPERYDKRDAMSMSASVSNMNFEWVEGVDGSSMLPKAKPPVLEDALKRDNNTLGCWRGHMNAMQRVVQERLSSALIMEDDADWDVNIRNQLIEFARGAKYVQEYPKGARTRSPYGDDWDVLWIGHCGLPDSHRPVQDQRIYLTRDDPTAVPPELFYGTRPDMSPPALNHTYSRLVYQGKGGRCLFAYAVSLRGARAFLNAETMSLEPAYPSDRGMARLCASERFDVKCIGPWPSLMGSHKAAGPMSKDSDRQKIADTWREIGETSQVVFSTRLNLKSLIGLRAQPRRVIKSQWPEKTLIKEHIGELALPIGDGMVVKKEEYLGQA